MITTISLYNVGIWSALVVVAICALWGIYCIFIDSPVGYNYGLMGALIGVLVITFLKVSYDPSAKANSRAIQQTKIELVRVNHQQNQLTKQLKTMSPHDKQYLPLTQKSVQLLNQKVDLNAKLNRLQKNN